MYIGGGDASTKKKKKQLKTAEISVPPPLETKFKVKDLALGANNAKKATVRFIHRWMDPGLGGGVLSSAPPVSPFTSCSCCETGWSGRTPAPGPT
jgi:hypothetical protein